MRRLLYAIAVCACAHVSPDRAAAAPAAQASPSPFDPPPLQPAAPPPRTTPRPPVDLASPAAATPLPWRERVLQAARRRLGHFFRGDCSAFVRRSYAEAGLALPALPARSASEALYRSLHPVRGPRPGDLAFFDGSFDRNRDGRGRDRFTHVALVEAVDGAAVELIHRSSRGIERLRMNLARPHDPSENGYLRKRRASDHPGVRYLSGELFAGFATAFPPEVRAAASR